jgi:CAAX protease family protein
VRPRWRPALAWLAVTLAFTFAYDALSAALDRPVVPEYLERAYHTAAFFPGLAVAVVVAAPWFEELLFRGFLYAGLARSRLGPLGAIAVTAASFAAIHVQYDLLDMSAILGLGLILGAARWRTGSTLLTLGLHAAVNLAAMVEVVWILGD